MTRNPRPAPLPADPDPALVDAVVEQLLEASSAERERLLRSSTVDAPLLQALKQRVDSNKDADPAAAMRAGQVALEAGSLSADPEVKALASWSYALGLTAHGDYHDALPFFSAAREQFQELNRPVDAARVATRQVQALAMSGDYEAALDLAITVRSTFEDVGLSLEAAHAGINLGAIYARLGRIAEAEQALEGALRNYVAAGNRLGMAQAHANLGYAAQKQDRYFAATEHLQAAMRIFEELELPQSAAGTLVDLALLSRRQGQTAKALEYLSRARGLYLQLGFSPDAALAQLEEARLRLELNLLDEAEQLARELVDTFRSRGLDMEHLEALAVLGTALARAGVRDEARDVLEQARMGWERLGNRTEAAMLELYRAALLLDEEVGAPVVSLDEVAATVRDAVAVLREADVRSGLAAGLVILGEIHQAQGEVADAERCLTEAWSLATELDIPNLVIRAGRLLGRHGRDHGDPAAAERYYLRAIEALEEVREALQVDEFKAAYLDDKLAVYSDMVDLLLEQQRLEEAFDFTERAKARALLDLLARGGDRVVAVDDPVAAKVLHELEAARGHLNRLYLEVEGHEPSEAQWAAVAAQESRVLALVRELDRLQPTQPAPSPLQSIASQELAGMLEPDQVVIEYFSRGEHLGVFVVTAEGLRVLPELAAPGRIQHGLERLHFFLKRVSLGSAYSEIYRPEFLQRQIDTQLRTLYDLLLRPLDLDLAGRQLIIVPHGPLHGVPFGSLHDGDDYLISRAAVALAPSATIFAHCARRSAPADGELLVFGVPTVDIPAVADEAEQVAAIFEPSRTFLGEDATLERFFATAGEASVLHIATHGVHRPDNPLFSGLRLADGWLAIRDLYGLSLQASLVVLSACESLSATSAEGEEMMGFSRGFLFAGVPAMVGSLWPVRDKQTAELMTAFYRELRAGAPVAEALRSAQLSVMAEHPNPYYWAAFSIVGDPRRKVVPPVSTG